MRLPPTSRSLGVVLNKGRWVSTPIWRTHLFRRYEFRSSHAVAAAQHPQSIATNEVLFRYCSSIRDREFPHRFILKPTEDGDRRLHQELLLADALDLYRTPEQSLSEEKLADLQYLASFRYSSLSVITAQFLLRQTPDLDPRIRVALSGNGRKKELEVLERKGYSWEEFTHWVWILIPNDPDKRMARLLAKPHHKPLFVLFYLLNEAPYFTDPDFLWSLLRYCKDWYSGVDEGHRIEDGQRLSEKTGDSAEFPQSEPSGSIVEDLQSKEAAEEPAAWVMPTSSDEVLARSTPSGMRMTPMLFSKLLEKLGLHANRLNPTALPVIANLAVSYITHLSEVTSHKDKAYQMQCQVFNAVLQAVSNPAAKEPYTRAVHGWKAITALLTFSSGLEQPLVIERDSYRGIRQVLLLLPKTDAERDTATALAKSWPPYRNLRDGMEEKAAHKEYLSRVVRAGFMMQEAGYAKADFDLTTDILGGMAPDGSPTIQTRANYPRNINHEHAMWAALIRTTRNAQEAWSMFKAFPGPDMKPDFKVYWELMQKIAAKPADPGHNNFPGDGRETFPFDDTNLSEFEKGRLTPPSIRSLTAEMFQSGVVIKGRSLAWLIRQAPDLRDALEYLDHSSLDPSMKQAIRTCMTSFAELPPMVLERPPRDVLRAFIDLLCRLQPNRTKDPSWRPPLKSYDRIRYALRLAKTGWQPTKNPSQAPWESILNALARPNIALSWSKPEENDWHVLTMANEVMEKAEERGGISIDMMHSFSRVLRKSMCSTLPTLLHTWSTSPDYEGLMSMYGPESTAPRVNERPTSKKDRRSWRRLLSPIFQCQISTDHRFTRPRPGGHPIIRQASSHLKKVWRAVSTIGPAIEPKPNKLISASNINNYMRTLAFLGDYEEMMLVLQWVVREWMPVAGQNLTMADADRLTRAFLAFRAFAEDMLGEAKVQPLREETMNLSCTGSSYSIYWPLDDEVEEYVLNDPWGDHQKLRELLKLSRKREQQRLEQKSSGGVE